MSEPEDEVTPFEGIIVATDALGTKSAASKDPVAAGLLLKLSLQTTSMHREWERILRFMGGCEDFEPFRAAQFQDTSILVFDGELSLQLLVRVSRWLGNQMDTELILASKPRGSLSFGQGATGPSFAIGEAWDDALAEMERADWMGWHATEKLTQQIQGLRESMNMNERVILDEHWAVYPVPTKGAAEGQLRAVPLWPRHYWVNQDIHANLSGARLLDYLKLQLSRHDFTADEAKQANTVAFLEWCLEQGLFANTNIEPVLPPPSSMV